MKHEDRTACSTPRAAIYIRVSSEEQAMHGLSLAAQREALLTYARQHGIQVVDLYADEGVTARKKYRSRPAFMRMLTDVQADRIDLILFIKLDRWFRNIADYYEVQRVLDAHGVQWIATEERYDTTTANGRLNLNIRLSIAQDESDRTAERIKFVFADKVRRGEVVSGKVPFGYRIEGKRMEADPETAPVVQDLFAHYIGCRAIRATCRYLLDEYGLYYTQTGLRCLLQNTRYIGRAHGRDDFCPPLVEKAVFERAQHLIASRAQRSTAEHPDRVYLFSGLAYCAECGARLSGHTVKAYTYYRCPRHAAAYPCPHQKNTSEHMLEQRLLHCLRQRTAAPDLVVRQQRAPDRSAVLRARTYRKLEKLRDLYLNDLIDQNAYAAEYRRLQEALASDTPATDASDVSWTELQPLEALYARLDRAHRKAFWSQVLARITITAEEDCVVQPCPSFVERKPADR